MYKLSENSYLDKNRRLTSLFLIFRHRLTGKIIDRNLRRPKSLTRTNQTLRERPELRTRKPAARHQLHRNRNKPKQPRLGKERRERHPEKSHVRKGPNIRLGEQNQKEGTTTNPTTG